MDEPTFRVLTIFWEEGQDPKVEAPGFAEWEIVALLRQALSAYEYETEDADSES
jgi:hypothetical protein